MVIVCSSCILLDLYFFRVSNSSQKDVCRRYPSIVQGESRGWILDEVDKASSGHSLINLTFKLAKDLSMVIQVFSIYKTVLETDIVKQKIASGKRELKEQRPSAQTFLLTRLRGCTHVAIISSLQMIWIGLCGITCRLTGI